MSCQRYKLAKKLSKNKTIWIYTKIYYFNTKVIPKKKKEKITKLNCVQTLHMEHEH